MIGVHRGEQIVEVLIDIITDFRVVKKLGYYISDNVDSNDTVWKATLAILYLDRDLMASWSHYLGHIINLATKAFIFGKNVDTFEAIVESVNESTPWDTLAMRIAQDMWQKKGALRKVYNIVVFIWISPQRREVFRKITVGDISDSKS